MKHLHQASQNQLYKFSYFENLQEITFEETLNNFFYFEFFNNQYLLINEVGCLSHIFVFNSTLFHPMEFGIVTGPIEQAVPVERENARYLVTRGATHPCYVGGTNIWKLNGNNLEVCYQILPFISSIKY